MELNIKNIKYDNILNDITCEFEEGKISTIITSNEEEKESLFNIITGIQKKYKGEVVNASIYKTKYQQKNPDDMLVMNTVKEELLLSLKNKNYQKETINKKIKDVLKIMKLNNNLLNRRINSLSTGEKKLISLATIIITNPKIIIMNDPFLYLDLENRIVIKKLLKKIAKDYNKTILILTKNINEVLDIGDNYIIIQGGKVIFKGKKKELEKNIDNIKVNDLQILDFIQCVRKKKNIKLDITFDIKELMKDVYRNVR